MTYIYAIILILIIYTCLMTYLYVKEKSKKEEKEFDREIDEKIYEIGKRLERIKERSSDDIHDLDLEEDGWDD